MRELLRKEQEERVLQFKKDTGLIKDKNDKNTNNEEEDPKTKDKRKDTNNISIEELMNKTSDSFSSDWARKLSGQLASDAEHESIHKNKPKTKEKDTEEEVIEVKTTDKNTKTRKKKPMAAIKKWFGDESAESSDSSEDTTEWEEIDRIKANKIKKKKAAKAKESKIKTTLTKASHILGIGPINTENIYKNKRTDKNPKEVLIDTTKNFLETNLGYVEEELETISITEAQLGKDDIIYLAFDDIKDLKELRIRISECGNYDIYSRIYIPPQVYKRFCYFNKICQDLRNQNPDTKTQIRIGELDLEIFTKTRGNQEPFAKINIEDVMDTADAPKFDHNINWKPKSSYPNRRKISYPAIDPLASKPKANHVLSRSNSTDQFANKKAKTNHTENNVNTDIVMNSTDNEDQSL